MIRVTGPVTIISSLGLRAGTVLGRLVLMGYLAYKFGLDAVGLFGFIQSVVGMIPSISGFATNYFVCRSLVSSSSNDRLRLISNRAALSAILTAPIALLGLVISFIYLSPVMSLLVAALIFVECLAFDLQMMLIAVGRAGVANAMLFVRSVSWLPILIFLDFAIGGLNAQWTIYASWLAGSLLCLALSMRALSLGLKMILEAAPLHLLAKKPSRILLYVSDIGIASQSYADRFVVGLVLPANAIGAYTICFTIANAVFTVVQASVVQTAMPRLVTAASEGSRAWFKIIWSSSAYVVAFVSIAAAILFIGAVKLPFTDLEIFRDMSIVIVMIMLVGALIRGCSEILSVGLYSLGFDHAVSVTNIIALIFGVSAVSFMSLHFGIVGAAFAAILTPLIVGCIRFCFLVSKGSVLSLR